ncbi:MAG: 2-polyprenyl-6-methoxyphenol hydroxylase-like oxidoreductase [Rubrobacter sp.]|nr:2-polyprenyl-6-methoxyphenol hydroxylase-like oxidoreductase [Rubrobacter sp.]
MGGLLAARVLSGHFGRVTVLERDALPEGPEFRGGVPQARHLHSLATRGSEILEELFPGLDGELADDGGPLLDQTADTVTEFPSGRLPRFRSGITMRAVTRSRLEWRIRRRVEARSGVRFVSRVEVTGLLAGRGAVTGVRLRPRGAGAEPEELGADLVVDASGGGSRAPRWLSELGYHPPRETVVDAGLGYASRWYRVPEDFAGDWKALAVLPSWPNNPRGGTLRQVEGGRWTAVLTGSGGDYPPTQSEKFVEFARSLPSPLIYDAIRDAEPLSPAYGYRRTANRRLHYEDAKLPERFLVLGDAATMLNPSYGSGMTAAALACEALDACLSERRNRRPRSLRGLSRRFHRRQVRAVAPCWTTTVSNDAQWSASGVEDLDPTRRLAHRVSEEVMELAVESPDTVKTMFEVKNVLKHPTALLRPGILLPALWRTAVPGSRPLASKRRRQRSPVKHPRPGHTGI